MRKCSAHNPFTRRRRGFTLLEACLTTIIVGIGVTAMMELLATGTVNNLQSTEMTTGINLARNVREMTINHTYSQVRALNNANYQPPIDSRAQAISSLGTWKQSVSIQAINPDNLAQNLLDTTPTAIRCTVTITHNGQRVCDLNWVRLKPMP